MISVVKNINHYSILEKSPFVGLFCLLLLVTGCGSEEPDASGSEDDSHYYEIRGEAHGTTYLIKYKDTLDRNLKPDVDELLINFDNSISNWNSASLVTEFNGYDEVHMDTFMFHSWIRSMEVHRKTKGAFNPAVFPLVQLWGFGLKNRQDIDSTKVDSVLAMIDLVKIDTVHVTKTFPGQSGVKLIDRGMNEIEFNAIAQGYSVELIGALLENSGVTDYMIELGGEIKCMGLNPRGQHWRIGIDHPDQTDSLSERPLSAKVLVKNKAIATSGSYRKFYEKDGKRYSHTIDPRTGYPVTHNLVSATVMADDCEFADAFATAFMVMGVDDTKVFLKDHPELGLEVFLIYESDGVWETFTSPGMMSVIEGEESL